MQIDNCLITAAGLGTRMGIIGEQIPKPLWPVFETTLLDLQLEYVKRFNPKKIFVNAHHNSEKIIEWAKDRDVIILVENELLGSGGCVHNLKNSDKLAGPITVVVNSDQFFLLTQNQINEGLELLKQGNELVIYGMLVAKGEAYNETVSEGNRLIEIKKPNGHEPYYTFSGVSLIDLDKLNYVSGTSGFFNSVCNFVDNRNIYFYDRTETVQFWDYGTKEKYVEGIFNAIHSRSEMKQIIRNAGVQLDKFRNCKNTISFNLYNTKIDRVSGTIEINSLIDRI